MSVLRTVDEQADLWRCPTSEKLADGTLATILGCGSTNVTGPDDDGLFDCLDCGIWFDPARESAS